MRNNEADDKTSHADTRARENEELNKAAATSIRPPVDDAAFEDYAGGGHSAWDYFNFSTDVYERAWVYYCKQRGEVDNRAARQRYTAAKEHVERIIGRNMMLSAIAIGRIESPFQDPW